MGRIGGLAVIGFVVWAISWFVSPHELVSMSGEMQNALVIGADACSCWSCKRRRFATSIVRTATFRIVTTRR